MVSEGGVWIGRVLNGVMVSVIGVARGTECT